MRTTTFIRDWRKDRGLTLEAIVERLLNLAEMEISNGQLSRIERGEQPYTQDLLEALAIVLQCEPADLIRRRPSDPDAIQPPPLTAGLNADQIRLVEGMVEQLRKAG